jgi:hypothetical protein
LREASISERNDHSPEVSPGKVSLFRERGEGRCPASLQTTALVFPTKVSLYRELSGPHPLHALVAPGWTAWFSPKVRLFGDRTAAESVPRGKRD